MIDTIGQFKVLEPLGPGSLGEVYRGRDTRVGRTVAITLVTDSVAENAEERERFLRDARAVAAISHPNIVTLYEAGEAEGRLYLVSEFIQGQTLKAIAAGRPLNPRRAISLASQVAEGLADAHASELVHGALTMDSVFVTPRGNAKIADFGMAGWIAKADRVRAPEAPRADYGSDLMSLGGITFEMLTGRAPSPDAEVPTAIDPMLPQEVDPVVGKALAGRYQSAATLAAELRAISVTLDVRLEATDAAIAPFSRRPTPAPRGSPIRWIVALLFLLAAIAAAWWRLGAS